MQSLHLTSGKHAGKKFRLRPWQKEIVQAIYRRGVKTAVVSLPRGQGKTQLAAGLMLAHLVGPEAEERGELYSAACDRHQASRIYREALAMVLADPELAGRVVAREYIKTLTDVVTGSVYTAMSADAKKGHGLAPSFAVYDELGQAPGRELYDALDTGLGKRDRALMVVISTQAPRDDHVMSQLVDHGEQVNAGLVEDPNFAAIIYRAPDDADPWSEETWRACNPALGDFLSLPDFRRQAEQARRAPAAEPAFRQLRLNMRCSAESYFIGAAAWLACGGRVDPAELEGRRCWCALDTASTVDLAALVAYFPEDDGAVLCWFWTPADTVLDHEHSDRAPFSVWVRDGLLLTTPGKTIDLMAPVLKLGELMDIYDVQGVAHDRWRVAELRRLLDQAGIDAPLIDHGQGFKDMAPAVDATERAILDGRLLHGGHPVLTMCVANASVVTDPSGNRKPDKQRSHGRIDGLVSLIMAVGTHAAAPAPVTYDFSLQAVLTA